MDVTRSCGSFSAFMNPRALVVVLAALSMIGALSIDAYLPALPAIAGRFGLSLAVAQQSLTVYLFAFATMTLFFSKFLCMSIMYPDALIILRVKLHTCTNERIDEHNAIYTRPPLNDMINTMRRVGLLLDCQKKEMKRELPCPQSP